MAEITKEQIAAWKKEHGDVFKLDVDGHTAYLKKPERKTLSYATSIGTTDPVKFLEILLNACWLGGDEAIKNDDGLFLSAGKVLINLIEVKEAELVKL